MAAEPRLLAGVYSGEWSEAGVRALAGCIGFQYDFEEQADRYGSALPVEQPWVQAFKPVAHVQVALEWSPIPSAVDALGEPTVELMEQAEEGAHVATCAWRNSAGPTLPDRPFVAGDEGRFRSLLEICLQRVSRDGGGSGVLLVAKPFLPSDNP